MVRRQLPSVTSSCILLCLIQYCVVQSFINCPVARPIRVGFHPVIIAATSKEDDTDASFRTTREWSMLQEWALLDMVPKFTIGEGVHARTFWAQLASATPILRNFTESEMQTRYKALCSSCPPYDQVVDTTTSTTTPETTASMKADSWIPLLPSPTILHDWRILSDDHKMTMSAIVDDGRAVWFPIQIVGTFGKDVAGLPLDDQLINSATPGGFVESVGGRIYELGQPAAVRKSEPAIAGAKQHQVLRTKKKRDKSYIFFNKLRKFSWKRAIKAVFLALVASSILSAAVGFGSGLGIASVESREMSLGYSSSLPSSSVIVQKLRGSSGSVVVVRSSYKSTSSVGAQRERAELRVEQEKELLDTISERLELDRVLLDLLRMEEDAIQSLAP